MKLIVNGKQIDCSESLTVNELLIKQKVKMPEMVSVELNGQILRRPEFESTVLKEGDKVEFLYFMGGGRGIN
ncbi:MAG: sulfur carrier protein ThiS [Sedimentisphaerales bacterium]